MFYCFFDQINAALVNIKDYLDSTNWLLYQSTSPLTVFFCISLYFSSSQEILLESLKPFTSMKLLCSLMELIWEALSAAQWKSPHFQTVSAAPFSAGTFLPNICEKESFMKYEGVIRSFILFFTWVNHMGKSGRVHTVSCVRAGARALIVVCTHKRECL